jgi:hypothetical protein
MVIDGQSEELHGHDGPPQEVNPVYLPTRARQPMRRVYLYRIIDHETVLGYRTDRPQPIEYDKMEGEIDTILREIASGEIQPEGEDLGDLTWFRRNYFVVVYEDPHDSMVRGDAVTFEHNTTNMNHTFRDGKDIPNRGDVRRFFCINHMLRQDGAHLPPRKREYYTVTVNHRRGPRPRSHSDTGTNTGPP